MRRQQSVHWTLGVRVRDPEPSSAEAGAACGAMAACGAPASAVPSCRTAVSRERARKGRNGGEAEDGGKIASRKEKRRGQMQESINEEPLCCVDRVWCQLEAAEALVQHQKSAPYPFTPAPCWWHLGVSVLCIYMHSSPAEPRQPAHLTWRAPLCS